MDVPIVLANTPAERLRSMVSDALAAVRPSGLVRPTASAGVLHDVEVIAEPDLQARARLLRDMLGDDFMSSAGVSIEFDQLNVRGEWTYADCFWTLEDRTYDDAGADVVFHLFVNGKQTDTYRPDSQAVVESLLRHMGRAAGYVAGLPLHQQEN